MGTAARPPRPRGGPGTVRPRSPVGGTRRSRRPGRRDSPAWPVPFVGYEGDASWLGYALIAGRWFTGPARPSRRPTSSRRPAPHRRHRSRSQPTGGRSASASSARSSTRRRRERRQPRPAWHLGGPRGARSGRPTRPLGGAAGRRGRHRRPTATRSGRPSGSGPGLRRRRRVDDGRSCSSCRSSASMGVVLVAISIGGVFDTVLLETRQRTREMAVLKAIGLTPRPGRGHGHRVGRAGRPPGRAHRRPDRPRRAAASSRLHGRGRREDAHPGRRSSTSSRRCCSSVSACGSGDRGHRRLPAGPAAARARIAPVLQAE